MSYFGDKKVRETRFFPAPFCARLAEDAKRLQTVSHLTLCFPVEFRPSRFRFAGVIPKKVILYEYSTVYTFGIMIKLLTINI